MRYPTLKKITGTDWPYYILRSTKLVIVLNANLYWAQEGCIPLI